MTVVSFSPIGSCRSVDGSFFIEVDPACRDGLAGLDGFDWIMVVWHAHLCRPDAPLRFRSSPYRGGPDRLGVFATRSPARPNPIGVSVVRLLAVDAEAGRLALAWIDCADGSPVLDLKPYQPSADRVETPRGPRWCAAWPKSVEASADFDWSGVFAG
jgi:tRNA-Thr(GGU) m(6)t(6)A37 methyltransferase TsaA